MVIRAGFLRQQVTSKLWLLSAILTYNAMILLDSFLFFA